MESTLTGILKVTTKQLFSEVDGEKFFKTDLQVAGDAIEDDMPLEVIISEYLIPLEDSRVVLTFFMKTIKIKGQKPSINYPMISNCELLEEGQEEINTAEAYGYITSKGELKSNNRLGENYITLIIKYRTGSDRNANYLALRAHGALARKLYKEASPSDHIKVNGINSISQNRLVLDVKEIEMILPSLSSKDIAVEQ